MSYFKKSDLGKIFLTKQKAIHGKGKAKGGG